MTSFENAAHSVTMTLSDTNVQCLGFVWAGGLTDADRRFCADINADTGRGPDLKTGFGAWVSEMIRIPRSNLAGIFWSTPEWGLLDERHSRVLSSVYIKS